MRLGKCGLAIQVLYQLTDQYVWLHVLKSHVWRHSEGITRHSKGRTTFIKDNRINIWGAEGVCVCCIYNGTAVVGSYKGGKEVELPLGPAL